jgi:site-specific recombinase XerD
MGEIKKIERTRIGLRDVRGLGPDQTIWDSEVRGFGARRRHGQAVAYFLFYRTKEGRQRWFTIGKHGSPWTPDMARDEARKLLVNVTEGSDPAADKATTRKAATVAELCDQYLAAVESGRLLTRGKAKKPSTLITDRSRVFAHIKPLLGSRKVAAVTSLDVDQFMHDVAAGKTKPHGGAHVKGGKGTATRTVGLLGAIFTYATKNKMRKDNPVHGVEKFADGERTRRLIVDDEQAVNEYALLGAAFRNAEIADIWPAAIAAARFLTLTGWRSGEAIKLRWNAVDLTRRTATLSEATETDTKTRKSIRPLSHAACDVLRGLARLSTCDRTALVFPGTRGDGPMTGFRRIWDRIAKLGRVPIDITPHVLRHSFASLAGDLGYSELTIAAMVGHKRGTTTSRYVHAADAVLLAAADTIANKTLELMGEKLPGATIVQLRGREASSNG